MAENHHPFWQSSFLKSSKRSQVWLWWVSLLGFVSSVFLNEAPLSPCVRHDLVFFPFIVLEWLLRATRASDDPLLCIISTPSTKSSQQPGNRSEYGGCVMERVEECPALLHKLARYKWLEGPQLETGVPVVPQQSGIAQEDYGPEGMLWQGGSSWPARKKTNIRNTGRCMKTFMVFMAIFCHTVQKSEVAVATHFLHLSLRNKAVLTDHSIATPH